MTESQRRALAHHWSRYGMDFRPAVHDLDAAFGRVAPRIMEIGFGAGESLADMAQSHPDSDFLGIEVHRPGVGRLLGALDDRRISNVRVICHDAVEVLSLMIPEAALDAVVLLFPDPWPKKRHHKRRLMQADFAALVARRLRAGGVLHMATDWEDYALHMMAVLERTGGLRNVAGPGRFAERPAWRTPTRFEVRGRRLGHGVWDLVYEAEGASSRAGRASVFTS